MKIALFNLIASVVILMLLGTASHADPYGVPISNLSTERRTAGFIGTSGVPVEADAGNMTSLFVNATTISNRWQGYYGNITGFITLDDAAMNTMYQWGLANPTGEIYAVNGSAIPAWSTVECLQFNRSVTATDLTDLQDSLGMAVNDLDNVNNTFNMSFLGSFNVVQGNTINYEDNCSMVSLFVNDEYNDVSFNETILIDDENDNNLVIYTAIISQSLAGFQGAPVDFQMVVGDNGDEVETTTYWFFVQLT